MTNPDTFSEVTVIVPAAGRAVRMGTAKQYVSLNGKPMLAHTIARMLALGAREVVLVVAPDDQRYVSIPGVNQCRVVRGGDSRAISVLNAMKVVEAQDRDWVLVHDGARPCIMNRDIERLFESVSDDDVGGILAVRVVETTKVAGGNRIERTLDRDRLWLAQTPQMFRFKVLMDALLAAGETVTDEASAVEQAGLAPKLVEGARSNIKVTTPADVALAEFYLKQQEQT